MKAWVFLVEFHAWIHALFSVAARIMVRGSAEFVE
jgi:hypothetical protein